jgi:hypothetical protein
MCRCSDLEKVMTKFEAIDKSNSVHVGPKKKKKISLGADLFVILPNEETSSDDL